MAKYVKVVVYVRTEEAEKLRSHGIVDVPTWVRRLVRDSILGMKPAPIFPDAEDAPKDPYLWESGS